MVEKRSVRVWSTSKVSGFVGCSMQLAINAAGHLLFHLIFILSWWYFLLLKGTGALPLLLTELTSCTCWPYSTHAASCSFVLAYPLRSGTLLLYWVPFAGGLTTDFHLASPLLLLTLVAFSSPLSAAGHPCWAPPEGLCFYIRGKVDINNNYHHHLWKDSKLYFRPILLCEWFQRQSISEDFRLLLRVPRSRELAGELLQKGCSCRSSHYSLGEHKCVLWLWAASHTNSWKWRERKISKFLISVCLHPTWKEMDVVWGRECPRKERVIVLGQNRDRKGRINSRCLWSDLKHLGLSCGAPWSWVSPQCLNGLQQPTPCKKVLC